MRNKAKDFPNHIKFSGASLEDEKHASKRANGTIKDRPQERMLSANEADDS
ncbi:spore protein [Alkalihalobacillus alcalophilus ATCC 27647 = CGMCC 1.3604]|uniref:Small, acid-soluble spore protein K n=1 Tax=Alkalihalobacillus alcalophilus ATCC 27647 = CGMCC 1.3604 TaxID=1218173 RepID=A0A094WLF9_ALKAL|nr:small, acid-soluble spore protein K [Alkalihalobacillus alcalophilus]KGA97696.1 spore protein [Alkalihalobacillus alcalophilus ATCC 27647 = CGMCC 1.3604]MED1562572.1 small, acid-soluble spore protein K [Alkalihalobacillus alcalophilus]THG91271.1 spore protein [Alkalihalobacillus alcalophilus ATCC 27647 = CGMCC 1.3604]